MIRYLIVAAAAMALPGCALRSSVERARLQERVALCVALHAIDDVSFREDLGREELVKRLTVIRDVLDTCEAPKPAPKDPGEEAL